MKLHSNPAEQTSAASEITISCSEFRRHMGRYLVLVQTEATRVTVARYGRPAAVMVSLEADPEVVSRERSTPRSLDTSGESPSSSTP